MKSQSNTSVIKKGSSLPEPYTILKDEEGNFIDLVVERTPSKDEVEDMLDWVVAYHSLGRWIVARFLATLPRNYGNTYGQAIHILERLDYSQSRLDDLRMLGARVPMGQVKTWLHLSHYERLYVSYDLTDEQIEHYIALMDQHRQDDPSGRTWSISYLTQRIKEDLGLVHPPGMPKPRTPEDTNHELVIENDRLRQALFEEQLTVHDVGMAVVGLAPYLEDLASDDPQTARAVSRIVDRIGGVERPAKVNGRRIRLEDNAEGGLELVATDTNGDSYFLWDPKFPDWAVQSIKDSDYYSEN